ncbi:MAG: FliI/YscN family ATPase [Planctomycetota bacterium]|nr:MAG: FliI/YscN family ATPase [Planctomycetota bacterium]
MSAVFDELCAQLRQALPTALTGRVVRTTGQLAAVADFPAPVGALVSIERSGNAPLAAEVIGFRDDLTLVALLDDGQGLRHGNHVRLVKTARFVRVGDALLGRVINAQGNCIDGRPQPALLHRAALERSAPPATARVRCDAPLSTGVRAIDGLLTCAKGQRMGIFAGSGVGKSMTLGMMARYTAADVNVVALVGERGREVNDFLERDLGPGLAKSVVVVATSDEPPLARVQAARTATAVAEYFRDAGRHVLLIMDSLSRLALAQREIGLAAGEPPTTRGFPPSVFALLPKLLERAGRTAQGSITGFYSVLVEGDDPNEPVADTVRGLLDGHTWLSRKLAARGHYPAIDILQSASRLMFDVADARHQDAAARLRELAAAYAEHEDMITLGAYRPGTSPAVDRAVQFRDEINQYLRQRVDEPSNVEAAREALVQLVRRSDAAPTSAAA